MSLLSNLIAHWSLDEPSGVRYSHNGLNNFADNNTVTQTPGKVGNAAQFTAANSEYLSIADNADLSTGNVDFTLAAWVYLDAIPAAIMTAVGKWNAPGGANGREYRLGHAGTGSANLFEFVVRTADDTANVTANDSLTIAEAGWYLIVAWHDAANDVIGISVNNDAPTTTAIVGGVQDTTTAFHIGSLLDAGIASNFWGGRIDEVGFWKRMLTVSERGLLYNNGNGLAFPWDDHRRVLRRNRLVGGLMNMRQPSWARG